MSTFPLHDERKFILKSIPCHSQYPEYQTCILFLDAPGISRNLLVPVLRTKVLLAIQIAGYFNSTVL